MDMLFPAVLSLVVRAPSRWGLSGWFSRWPCWVCSLSRLQPLQPAWKTSSRGTHWRGEVTLLSRGYRAYKQYYKITVIIANVGWRWMICCQTRMNYKKGLHLGVSESRVVFISLSAESLSVIVLQSVKGINLQHGSASFSQHLKNRNRPISVLWIAFLLVTTAVSDISQVLCHFTPVCSAHVEPTDRKSVV